MNEDELNEFGEIMAEAAVRYIILGRIESGKYKIQNSYNNILVIKDDRSCWSVVGVDGRVIVPFKKYGWIDGFQQGLARVRTYGLTTPDDNTFRFYTDLENGTYIEGKENIKEYVKKDRRENPDKYAKWGIINEKGEEVLPAIYDKVWVFFGKNRNSTTVEKDGEESIIRFIDIEPNFRENQGDDYHPNNDLYDSSDYFSIDDCYDCEGNFDYDRLEDAYLDGEWVPDDY